VVEEEERSLLKLTMTVRIEPDGSIEVTLEIEPP
jgi:hypothetical protein